MITIFGYRIGATAAAALAVLAALLVGWAALAVWDRVRPDPPPVVQKAARVVEKAAEKAQTGHVEAVQHLNTEARKETAHVERRSRQAADRIIAADRAIPPQARGPDRPDLDELFYRGVCASRLYDGYQECGGYRGQPEG